MSKKLIEIPSNPEKVFKQYLYLTTPLNKLTDSEIRLLSHLLYLFYEERDRITDDNVKWLKIFSTESRKEIMDFLGMNEAAFNNILSILRKKKVIVNNQIPKYYIPQIDENGFELVFKFKFNNNG